MTENKGVIIELNVRNHPGVMSHVTGLFARRSFNLEGILCGPVDDGSRSVMYLLVDDDSRLEQIVKQAQKLRDVLGVSVQTDGDCSVFSRLRELIRKR